MSLLATVYFTTELSSRTRRTRVWFRFVKTKPVFLEVLEALELKHLSDKLGCIFPTGAAQVVVFVCPRIKIRSYLFVDMLKKVCESETRTQMNLKKKINFHVNEKA